MKKTYFENLSHIDIVKKIENDNFTFIHKGEKYSAMWLGDLYPVEDRIYRFLESFKMGYKFIAKQDRWKAGMCVYSSIEEAINDWNDTILFDEENQKWYYKAYCVFHFLDGSKIVKYFNTDEEAEEYAKNYLGLNWKLIEN